MRLHVGKPALDVPVAVVYGPIVLATDHDARPPALEVVHRRPRPRAGPRPRGRETLGNDVRVHVDDHRRALHFSDRALKSRLPPHEQCAAILGHEARAVNRDLRTRSIAPAASQLWAALRPAGPKATPGASARTTTE